MKIRTLTSVVFLVGCLAACLLTGGGVASSSEICELTVEDLVGAARKSEPVRMGVPLPEGLVKDVGELALTDASGRQIPCQFKAVTRWLKDKSLRWVHVIFQTSVAAKGKVRVKLVKGKAAKSAGKMKVAQNGNAVTVENGVLKLAIKGQGFNLFDSAWYDPTGQFGAATQVVKPHAAGIIAMLDDKAHKPSADSKVSIEEQGSEGAVIKVQGRLTAGGGGEGPFSYVCYIHVFQGSPEVRVTFAYTMASGTGPASKVVMKDLSVVLPTALSGARGGGGSKVFSGKSARVVARGSDQIAVSVAGGSPVIAKGKSVKAKDLGWVALGSGNKSLAVGLRWFWQMHPRAVEATADGKLRAGLLAREVQKPLEVYMGQGRTHYLTYRFGGGSDAELGAFYSGRQMPLRAVCTPKYYCRDSQAFGPLVESDPALFPADLAGVVKKYDEGLKSSVKYIEKKIDGHRYGSVTMDSYGYNAWGDLFHWANKSSVKSPWNILWESNYYDYPWACLIQFARTADPLYLDICDRNGLHLADVFMCKWHPKQHMRGACRYSPPANHVGLDSSTAAKPKPYVSVEFNHHKAQSMLHRYLLLADLRARDDFMLALNNATLNREGSWRQCRGAGAKLWTLSEGIRLLGGDDKAMAMMKRTAKAGRNHLDKKGGKNFGHKNGKFMYGFASEGLIRYWWITKDKGAIETIKGMNDYLISANKLGAAGPNSAMSMAFLWRQTGDKKYRDAAMRFVTKRPKASRPKHFGSKYRSTAYALYYLSKLTDKK